MYIKTKHLYSLICLLFVIVLIYGFLHICCKNNNRQLENYDSINNQLNPNYKETENDFKDMTDPNDNNIMMTGSTFEPNDLAGQFRESPTTEPLPVNNTPPGSYLLDDGNNGKTGIHFNMCSKQCCSAQYPIPFPLKKEVELDKLNDLAPTNYFCNNAWQNSGCLCASKDQVKFMEDRGGNA